MRALHHDGRIGHTICTPARWNRACPEVGDATSTTTGWSVERQSCSGVSRFVQVRASRTTQLKLHRFGRADAQTAAE